MAYGQIAHRRQLKSNSSAGASSHLARPQLPRILPETNCQLSFYRANSAMTHLEQHRQDACATFLEATVNPILSLQRQLDLLAQVGGTYSGFKNLLGVAAVIIARKHERLPLASDDLDKIMGGIAHA